ncbi:MAG: hypothetical protein JNL74_01055 [Fibrobacteres bacterium]|nr:hypothetical protein [Fibrobacterota bacterium]
MKTVNFVIMLCSLQLFALPVDWYGRVQNTAISQYDSTFSWNIRQQLSVNLEETRWSKFRLHADIGFQTELDNTGSQLIYGADRLQIYGLKVSGDILAERALTLEAGRLFLYEGLPAGALDGFRISGYKESLFDGCIYGGVESHYLYSPTVYKGSEGLVFGFRAGLQLPKESRLELSYLMDMLPEDEPVYATDTSAVPAEEDEGESTGEETDPFIRHLTGISFCTGALPKSNFTLHYIHDFIKEEPQLISAGLRVIPIDRIQLQFRAEISRPEVLGRSYFERFEIKEHTLLSLATEIQLYKSYGVTADYGLLTIEEENAQRLDIRLTDNRGSIGVVLERGSLGDATGFVADYGVEFLDVWTLSAAIDYSQYRIQENYELDKAVGNALRIAYGKGGFTAELEGRWLSDRTLLNTFQIMNRVRFAW